MADYDITSLEEDEFLAGPDRYEDWLKSEDGGDLLEINNIFGKTLAEVLVDYPRQLKEISDFTPSIKAEGFRFGECEAGIVLFAPDGEIAGGYLGTDLALEEKYRGKGLGAELVLEYALRNEYLPTWWLDEAAYSEAGEGAHRAAWRLLRKPEIVAAKREALAEVQRRNVPAFG